MAVSLRFFSLKCVLVPLLFPLLAAHPAAAAAEAATTVPGEEVGVPVSDSGRNSTSMPRSTSTDSEPHDVAERSLSRSSSTIVPPAEAGGAGTTNMTGCCGLVPRGTRSRARSTATTMEKMKKKIVTTIVEKEGKTWKPRYIAHYLFGESRGDALALGLVRHIWVVFGVFTLGVAFHEIPYDSPFPTAPKIGVFIQTLMIYSTVLLLDVKIMGELRSFFQSYFLAGNMLVQGICTMVMYWKSDPLYSVLLIFCYPPILLYIGCVDAFPFHLFGTNRLTKTMFLLCGMGGQALNGMTMVLGYFRQMPNGDVYDPVIFSGTYVETKLSSIALTCITNFRVSNFYGLFFLLMTKPRSYKS